VCYSRTSRFGETQPLNDRRREVIRDVRKWRYTPFVRDGQTVAAIVTETVAEQELPKATLHTPDVPLDQVHLTLRRSGCFGSCPSYGVEVYGDGHAVYSGSDFVDVVGEHRYSISQQAVAKLFDSLRSKDLWSLRDSYRASITDNAAYQITMQLGEQTRSIEDYVGQAVGMPVAVTEFEKELDTAAGSENWIHLSSTAVERLKAEGFLFSSQEGGALLARAVANSDSHDDKAMLALMELGAPVDTVVHERYRGDQSSLIELALRWRRETLIDALIGKGALQTDGVPDQLKLDQAFRAALAGGKLSLVQKIWNASAGVRPSLTYLDRGDEDASPPQQSPVTLLLSPPYDNAKSWQGREIAQWLAAMGCNLNAHRADGATLLHVAAQAGDVKFVRYLLDQGIDPSTPGRFGLPALGGTHSEDVTMLLLEAGTDVTRLNDKGSSLRKFADYNHWQRVIAWLDQHAGLRQSEK
jgi:hypothetical protein